MYDMNLTRRLILGFGLLLLLFAGLVTYVSIFDTTTYTVEGRVAGVQNQGQTLVVEHQDIPGYMPAMTMPIPVADPGLIDSVDEGAAIRFRLAVSDDGARITSLTRIPDTAVAQHPAQTVTPMNGQSAAGQTMLQTGDRVPSDLRLVNQAGNPVQLRDFRGQMLVLTFIYTRCPLPTYCPRMSKQFAALQPTLRSQYGSDVQLLSISFDPGHDTPEVLRDYSTRYTNNLDTWTFATGDSTEIQRATALFGVYTRQAEAEITHNLVTALIDPSGRVQRLWRGNDWDTDDVLQAVDEVMTNS